MIAKMPAREVVERAYAQVSGYLQGPGNDVRMILRTLLDTPLVELTEKQRTQLGTCPTCGAWPNHGCDASIAPWAKPYGEVVHLARILAAPKFVLMVPMESA